MEFVFVSPFCNCSHLKTFDALPFYNQGNNSKLNDTEDLLMFLTKADDKVSTTNVVQLYKWDLGWGS